MAGLVGYDSSDEDSGDEQPQMQPVSAAVSKPQTEPQPQPTKTAAVKPVPSHVKASPETQPPAPGAAMPAPPPPPPAGAAPLGPSLPPMESSTASLPEPSLSPSSNPSSPYTTTRSLIHDLTLPSIPNFDIPPSPSGSPSAAASATNAKFQQFLTLKKRGTHFNAKLEQSSALRNPALTDKLLQFVDVLPPGKSDQKDVQYQTTLGEHLWNPGAFPTWAYRDGLKRGRERVGKEREAARTAPGRSGVEFVSGTTTTATTGGGTGGLSKGEKRKSGWQ